MSQLGISMTSTTDAPKPPKRRRSWLAVVVSLSIVMAFVAAGAFVGYNVLVKSDPDYVGAGSGNVVVKVSPGEAISTIGKSLQRVDVVKSSEAFVSAASNDSRATAIQPGSYHMRLKMSATAALDILTNSANRIADVTIPEGARAAKVIEIASEGTGIALADFQAILKNPANIGLPAYANNHVEGFLFPSSYDFGTGATAQSVLTAMVTKYKHVAKELDLEVSAAAIGQSPYDILKIASIVQAEGLVNDFAKISQVIYNRLACTLPTCKEEFIQGRLQMDSTLNYANSTNDLNLSASELAKSGPYNTHKNKGLPPTPIDNPGVEALAAALRPQAGNWLYFVSDPRFTRFSDTFAQQRKAEAEYRALR